MDEVWFREITDSNTDYLWRLLNDLEEISTCENCENTIATWKVQSDEECPSIEFFCGTCTSNMLVDAEIEMPITTHDGELIVWFEASNDGNLDEGLAIQFWDDFEKDYGYCLCIYYENTNRNRIYTKERR